MKGVVATGDARTTAAAAALLGRGGNAIDAAVGATFAAFAAEPILTAPFGGGFATVGDSGGSRVWDFFANVPGEGLAAADTGAKIQSGLDFQPLDVDFGATTQRFHVGRGAAAASAFLPGLLELQRRKGRLPLATVLEPAQELARHGVELSEGIARFVAVLAPILTLTPGTAEIFAPRGRVLRAGERFYSPDLAALLTTVGRGDIATPRAAFLRTSGAPFGRLTAADLDAATVVERQPTQVPFAGHVVEVNPPPSTGGLWLAFALRLLDTTSPSVWRDLGATRRHLLAAMAVANAARAKTLADGLLGASDEAAAALGARFLSEAHLAAWKDVFLRAVRDGPVGLGAMEVDLGGTTHISVIDAEGLACATTSSNGEGCGHLVDGCGVMANNFMGEDDLHPRGFFVQRPGSRLSSMMCPTLVRRDGAIVLALGTGGSNRIRTALLQVLVFHLACGWDLARAVGAARMHYEGERLTVEARGPSETMAPTELAALKKLVPDTVVFDEANMFFGGVHAAGRGVGAGDPRRSGSVTLV